MSQETSAPARTQAGQHEGAQSAPKQWPTLEDLHAQAQDLRDLLEQARQDLALARAESDAMEQAWQEERAAFADFREAMRAQVEGMAQNLARMEGENAGLRFAMTLGRGLPEP